MFIQLHGEEAADSEDKASDYGALTTVLQILLVRNAFIMRSTHPYFNAQNKQGNVGVSCYAGFILVILQKELINLMIVILYIAWISWVTDLESSGDGGISLNLS